MFAIGTIISNFSKFNTCLLIYLQCTQPPMYGYDDVQLMQQRLPLVRENCSYIDLGQRFSTQRCGGARNPFIVGYHSLSIYAI